MHIVQLPGTDKHLYELVAPLIMNPKVLKQNYNFPFRTSERYEWFIAVEGEEVEGFVPVEHKASEDVINNYYIKGKDPETLKLLLGHILTQRDESKDLAAISFVEDKGLFQDLGFMPEKVWTRYVKMKKTPVKNEFIQEKQ